MTADKRTPEKRISLKLNPAQKEQIKGATGKDVEAIELGVEELEERIAPTAMRFFNEGGPEEGIEY